MIEPGTAEAAAKRLVDLSREVADLEAGRKALLNRVDKIRADLQAYGQRTATINASLDMLYERASGIAAAMAELRSLEEEAQEFERGLAEKGQETSIMSFEADSFQEALDEAEDEMDRLSSIILSGRPKNPRGH
ncbi:MAG TPA: hypothetical protein VNO70_08825 [Blastocatellia bacterium]|nr:hypothetical protein [Blastocatellia bacterium]